MASLMDDRYSRIAEMPLVGPDGLAKLQRSSVAIVAIGNVGGQLGPHFSIMGCGLTLVDRDVVARVNLGTQGFSSKEDVGRSKVEARARALRAGNDRCSVTAVEADIVSLGMGVLRNVDLVFCCLDNRKDRVVVNDIVTRLGLPWVDTAVDGTGTMMLGRVAAYDAVRDDAACYLCPHDSESLLEIVTENAPRGCPVLGATETVETPPTLAISALGGAVAAVAAAGQRTASLCPWVTSRTYGGARSGVSNCVGQCRACRDRARRASCRRRVGAARMPGSSKFFTRQTLPNFSSTHIRRQTI